MNQGDLRSESQNSAAEQHDALHIAIVGMAGRFPGSETLEEFWRNLRDGVECISFLSDEELQAIGVPRRTTKKKNFVKAGALLRDVGQFDAAFFGYSPREAELMDPQHRIFLECSWEALESAGYQSETYPGLIGAYAGTSLSSYLLYNVLPSLADIHSEENFEAMIGNDKDFLSTRVAYKLNLKGPAVDVQTGCSTSLVAIHLACQALLCYQCDMALAGGVSVQVPQRTGYYYIENGINSPDGHCRAFDAQAQGTIFGSGAGVVVLKRLGDAIEDRDHIHAVIRASAINNDGAQKVGYTAPSVEGQCSVIATAQSLAGVAPETISYVECHGTGTNLGDPIEVLALTNAFRAGGNKGKFCALGSVKSNVGHLDAAAGVAGLLKTVLAIEHKLIPPSLHFESPNPKIDFENSPFYVNRELQEWNNAPTPLRAGVSSFGIGGTNAHVIVEQAPSVPAPGPSRDHHVLLLSAKTPTALDILSDRLAKHLENKPEAGLADVAYTLATGRKAFSCRRAVTCRDAADAVSALQQMDPGRVFSWQHSGPSRSVVFMFPGGGAQYAGMGVDLYRTEAFFRDQIDLCADIVQPLLGFDIRTVLYPNDSDLKEASRRMKETTVALPALFITEYALAKLWISWRLVPQALIGHSLGEYTAAALSGVFSLQDALALAVTRAKLFAKLPPGSMAGVPLPPAELEPWLDASLSIAAVNSESQCVVSGPQSAVEDLVRRLAEQEIECRRLQIDVASHSHMVEPILQPFREFLRTLRMHPPQLPYVSNVTGTWITEQQATDPEYWVGHLRKPVLFGPGIKELLSDPNLVLLEVGPSHTLATLAKMEAGPQAAFSVLTSMRHPYDRQSDVAFLLGAAGKLWLAGASVDWQKFYKDERRMRVPLPTYPFERQRYWIESQFDTNPRQPALGKIDDVEEWFYAPSWKRLPLSVPAHEELSLQTDDQAWILFLDDEGLGACLKSRLLELNAEVWTVSLGREFQHVGERQFAINAASREDYALLLEQVQRAYRGRLNVVHLWSVNSATGSFQQCQCSGMYSLVYFAQAASQQNLAGPIDLWVISTNLHRIEGGDELLPEKATVLSPCIIIPQEYENFSCWSIDVDLVKEQLASAARRIMSEIKAGPQDKVIAYRGERRWVRTFEPVRLGLDGADQVLGDNRVYLITGGLGGIGLQLAANLAQRKGTKLALIVRSLLPPADQWEEWLRLHPGGQDPECNKIRKLIQLRNQGAEVMVISADVADEQQMQVAVAQVVQRFGTIDGVIHAAGLSGKDAVQLLSDLRESEFERNLHAKVWGLKALAKALENIRPKFCVLFSSNASVLGGLGSVAYSAANLFMDAFAEALSATGEPRWMSVNWDGWLISGDEHLDAGYQTSLQKYAMTPDESWEAFRRVIASGFPGQTVVSTGNLQERMRLWLQRPERGMLGLATDGIPPVLHVRPALSTAYVPPRNELESTVVAIWQKMLGIEQLGINDNFFDLGGNSLIGLKMIAAVKKALAIDLPMMALFEGPTVSALCRYIEHKEPAQPAFDESRSRGQRRRQSAVVQHELERAFQAGSPAEVDRMSVSDLNSMEPPQ